MWADCLGFWSLKRCPQPQTRWWRFLKPQRKPETFSQVPSVIPALPPDPEQDRFLTEIPPKKWCGGSEKVCNKKKEGILWCHPEFFCVCFFLIRNQVFEWCKNHHMFKQNWWKMPNFDWSKCFEWMVQPPRDSCCVANAHLLAPKGRTNFLDLGV